MTHEHTAPDPDDGVGAGRDEADPADPADRVREGVGHLQVAAQEVIAAVRVLLDAAEEVVNDPSSAAGLFATLGDVARTARGGGGPDSWEAGRADEDGDDGGVERIPVT